MWNRGSLYYLFGAVDILLAVVGAEGPSAVGVGPVDILLALVSGEGLPAVSSQTGRGPVGSLGS
jgi:hypothetical protein